MLENRKPRHIRDIAHLYISRPQPRTQDSFVSVWITAEHKRCFPGFHVANLAASLSARNGPVRLLDRSGLLPNAGYFMSLSPRRYIRWGEDGARLAAGLGGVEIDCSSREFRNFPPASRPVRVEIVHLPPFSPADRFEAALEEARKRVRPVSVLVVLRSVRTLGEGLPPSVEAELRPAATFVIRLAEFPVGRIDTPPGAWKDEPDAIDLGRVVDWERSIDDRVPPVLRAPNSALAQTYRSASEALLFKINDLGRKHDATRALGISAGIGSRPRHR